MGPRLSGTDGESSSTFRRPPWVVNSVTEPRVDPTLGKVKVTSYLGDPRRWLSCKVVLVDRRTLIEHVHTYKYTSCVDLGFSSMKCHYPNIRQYEE